MSKSKEGKKYVYGTPLEKVEQWLGKSIYESTDTEVREAIFMNEFKPGPN
jgi:hypothetical protein